MSTLDVPQLKPYLHRPVPPTPAMIAALQRPGATEDRPPQARPPAIHALVELKGTNPFFRFEFMKPYSNVYTLPQHKFVLRKEHYPELVRLTVEFNKHRSPGEFAIAPSDIVNALLDILLEHPVCFVSLRSPLEIRHHIARELYRKAFFHFMRLYEHA